MSFFVSKVYETHTHQVLQELKIKVSFRQVTDSEYQARLEAGGFPPAIAKSTSELTSMVGEGSNYLESPMAGPGVINARDVSSTEKKTLTLINVETDRRSRLSL